MKDFEELKSIWHSQTELPKLGYEDILKNIKTTKSRFANKLLFQVFSLTVAIAIMVFVLLNTPFILGTSHLGMSIFIVCCVVYLFIQLKDFKNINNSERLLEKPEEYIAYLKSYKRKRYVLNTQIFRIYMFFIALGLVLYFIEIFYLASFWQTAMAVAFTIAWFLICYFVFMRLYIRKEEARINEMIQNLERLQKQFDEEELI